MKSAKPLKLKTRADLADPRHRTTMVDLDHLLSVKSSEHTSACNGQNCTILSSINHLFGLLYKGPFSFGSIQAPTNQPLTTFLSYNFCFYSVSRWGRTITKTFLESNGQNLFRTVEKIWKNQIFWSEQGSKKKNATFAHFPRPGEIDPYG